MQVARQALRAGFAGQANVRWTPAAQLRKVIQKPKNSIG
jgi:hypothetical protein